MLAVGSHDNCLYIYKIKDDGTYHLYAKDHRHHAWINAIDWTQDSENIRTFSGDYETLYYNVKDKTKDTHGSETFKDKFWASNTMKYGSDREMNPAGEDKTHINDVEASIDNSVIFSADDFGLVNAFQWPDPKVADSRSYCGHSEHVSRIQITPDQQRIFSVGGEDKTLIQWRIKGLKVTEAAMAPVKKVEEVKEAVKEAVQEAEVAKEAEPVAEVTKEAEPVAEVVKEAEPVAEVVKEAEADPVAE